MASKKNEKAEKRNKQQFEEEKASVERFREIAPRMKKSLKGIGCDLPFYDYLDSYDLEFHRIANEALESIPSLLAVEEFDAENSGDSENPREYKGFRQVFFELDSRFNNYTKRSPGSNVCGSATFMLNSSCELGTLI